MMVKMVAMAMLIFSIVFPSVLSDRAALLTTAHKWTIMPVNSSLGGLELGYSLLYWTDSGIWDPVRKKVRWVGGPGTCCANPADYKMINYDEASDVWTVQSTPFSGSGHSYDANAFNPNAGLHYFGLIGSPIIHTWNDTAWSVIPSAPFSSTTPSLTWFPDINNGKGGLVFMGDNGGLAWYDGTKWNTLPSIGLSGYNAFSQYNPVNKIVWLGGGEGIASYILDTNLTTRKAADAPVALGNGTSIETCDPVSGKFLVWVATPNTWYEFNPVANGWTQITDMTPKITPANMFHVPVPEYGVILFFNLASTAKTIYIYKHTLSTSVEKKDVPKGNGGLSWAVSPNPAYSSARISLHNIDKSGDLKAGIYSPDGRLVRDLTGARASLLDGIAWNTAGLPAGIYVLKAASGKVFASKRIVVIK